MFTDENGITNPAEVTITHFNDLRVNEGNMEVTGDSPSVFRNRHEIVPFARGSLTTNWKSTNPVIGVLYGIFSVETRILIQSVKRNRERFPHDFMFQLSIDEFEHLRSQIVISNRGMSSDTRCCACERSVPLHAFALYFLIWVYAILCDWIKRPFL